jgi:hypothetical protein
MIIRRIAILFLRSRDASTEELLWGRFGLQPFLMDPVYLSTYGHTGSMMPY